jgi:glutaredoxin-related protein
MERLTLAADRYSPSAARTIAELHRSVVEEVASTVAREPFVVVGMAQNPYVRRARKLLEAEGIQFTYLEYGSYLSQWKARLAIKLWAGFPTFPMVFRGGTLLGGLSDIQKLREEGKLKAE